MASIVQMARARHTRPGAVPSLPCRRPPMIHRVLAMVMLAIAVSTVSVYADDELDTLAAGVERSAATPQAERAAVDRMAKALTTAPDTLRAERAASRLGWGDLYIAYRIATRGGHPVDK